MQETVNSRRISAFSKISFICGILALASSAYLVGCYFGFANVSTGPSPEIVERFGIAGLKPYDVLFERFREIAVLLLVIQLLYVLDKWLIFSILRLLLLITASFFVFNVIRTNLSSWNADDPYYTFGNSLMPIEIFLGLACILFMAAE